jgi:hypothetical protein
MALLRRVSGAVRGKLVAFSAFKYGSRAAHDNDDDRGRRKGARDTYEMELMLQSASNS